MPPWSSPAAVSELLLQYLNYGCSKESTAAVLPVVLRAIRHITAVSADKQVVIPGRYDTAHLFTLSLLLF